MNSLLKCKQAPVLAHPELNRSMMYTNVGKIIVATKLPDPNRSNFIGGFLQKNGLLSVHCGLCIEVSYSPERWIYDNWGRYYNQNHHIHIHGSSDSKIRTQDIFLYDSNKPLNEIILDGIYKMMEDILT